MTRTEINAEIARIESSAPSRIASFAARRGERIAELRAMLANAAPEAEQEDAGLARIMDVQRRQANAVRAQERRGY